MLNICKKEGNDKKVYSDETSAIAFVRKEIKDCVQKYLEVRDKKMCYNKALRPIILSDE